MADEMQSRKAERGRGDSYALRLRESQSKSISTLRNSWQINSHQLPEIVKERYQLWGLSLILHCTKSSILPSLSTSTSYIPLDKPGPRRRGTCLIKKWEARKASYLQESFLISIFVLLSFLRSSLDMASMPRRLERSMSCSSPKTHKLMRGRGMVGKRTVSELRLSSVFQLENYLDE